VGAVNTLEVKEEMDVNERLEKIKSQGYWRVNIRPIDFDEHRIESLERCWEIIEDCRVLFFIRPYPVINKMEKAYGYDWIQSGDEINGASELWRFYQSGQFIHYFPCMEDYSYDEEIHSLNIWSVFYKITEIYEFATRLAEKGVYKNHIKISIKLIGMMNRGLSNVVKSVPVVFPSRIISKSNEIDIESTLPVLELLGSAHDEAINKTLEVFSKFNFELPRIELSTEQQRLL
jgi:hypothetical protein